MPREANTHTPIKPSAAITVPTTIMGFLFPNGVSILSESLPKRGRRMSPNILSAAMITPCSTESSPKTS